MPALYSLAYHHLLPERFAIVGAARSEETDDEFRARMKDAVKAHARDPFDKKVWDKLAAGMHYTRRVLRRVNEDNLEPLPGEAIDEQHGTNGNRVYYFAVPPSAIAMLITALGERRTGTAGSG